MSDEFELFPYQKENINSILQIEIDRAFKETVCNVSYLLEDVGRGKTAMILGYLKSLSETGDFLSNKFHKASMSEIFAFETIKNSIVENDLLVSKSVPSINNHYLLDSEKNGYFDVSVIVCSSSILRQWEKEANNLKFSDIYTFKEKDNIFNVKSSIVGKVMLVDYDTFYKHLNKDIYSFKRVVFDDMSERKDIIIGYKSCIVVNASYNTEDIKCVYTRSKYNRKSKSIGYSNECNKEHMINGTLFKISPYGFTTDLKNRSSLEITEVDLEILQNNLIFSLSTEGNSYNKNIEIVLDGKSLVSEERSNLLRELYIEHDIIYNENIHIVLTKTLVDMVALFMDETANIAFRHIREDFIEEYRENIVSCKYVKLKEDREEDKRKSVTKIKTELSKCEKFITNVIDEKEYTYPVVFNTEEVVKEHIAVPELVYDSIKKTVAIDFDILYKEAVSYIRNNIGLHSSRHYIPSEECLYALFEDCGIPPKVVLSYMFFIHYICLKNSIVGRSISTFTKFAHLLRCIDSYFYIKPTTTDKGIDLTKNCIACHVDFIDEESRVIYSHCCTCIIHSDCYENISTNNDTHKNKCPACKKKSDPHKFKVSHMFSPILAPLENRKILLTEGANEDVINNYKMQIKDRISSLFDVKGIDVITRPLNEHDIITKNIEKRSIIVDYFNCIRSTSSGVIEYKGKNWAASDTVKIKDKCLILQGSPTERADIIERCKNEDLTLIIKTKDSLSGLNLQDFNDIYILSCREQDQTKLTPQQLLQIVGRVCRTGNKKNHKVYLFDKHVLFDKKITYYLKNSFDIQTLVAHV